MPCEQTGASHGTGAHLQCALVCVTSWAVEWPRAPVEWTGGSPDPFYRIPSSSRCLGAAEYARRLRLPLSRPACAVIGVRLVHADSQTIGQPELLVGAILHM